MSYRHVDADDHFYEQADASTRYGTEGVKRFVQWWEQGKKRRTLFGNEVVRWHARSHVQSDRQARAFHETLTAPEHGQVPSGSRDGELEPLNPAYMNRDQRVGCMDEQNLAGSSSTRPSAIPSSTSS